MGSRTFTRNKRTRYILGSVWIDSVMCEMVGLTTTTTPSGKTTIGNTELKIATMTSPLSTLFQQGQGRSPTCGTTRRCSPLLAQAVTEHLFGPTRTTLGGPQGV